VTRRQSPVQITALGIIALPHSQERHARQHHEPALPLEKSIEPGRTHPIPPAFSPTEFLRRLRSAETLISFNGKIGANLLIPALAAVGAVVCSVALWTATRGSAGPPRVRRNCPMPLMSVADRVGPNWERACGRLLRRRFPSARPRRQRQAGGRGLLWLSRAARPPAGRCQRRGHQR
jgi:hypothetical protein